MKSKNTRIFFREAMLNCKVGWCEMRLLIRGACTLDNVERRVISMKQIPYEYRNLPIPGGGYVTGFLYSEKEKDVLYIRTDIGGTYRFDAANQRWVSLIGHVTMEDLSETFPISLALDENRPGSLYIACGVN